jgi:hypothetical protein
MKTKILLIILVFTTFCKAQVINVPDNNLKLALLNHIPAIDTNSNGQIETSEAQILTEELILNNKSITNITGIEAFINVKKINLATNNLASTVSFPLVFNSLLVLEELDLSNNNQILAVNCNQVVPLKKLVLDSDVSSVLLNSQTQLLELKCSSPTFQSLSALNKTQIQKLNIFFSETTTYINLSLGSLNNLTELYLDSHNNVPYLNAFTGTVPNLQKISFNNISLTNSIDFLFLINIKEFTYKGLSSYSNLFSKLYTLVNLESLTLNSFNGYLDFPNNLLDFSNNLQLEYINIHFAPTSESCLPINLASNINLKYLELYYYNSNTFSLNNNVQLESLILNGSNFESAINLTNNVNLKKILLYGVSLNTIPAPYTLNLSQNHLLEEVTIFDWYLNNINFGNVSTINKLEILESRLETINLTSFSSLIDLNFNSIKDVLEIDLNNCINLDTVRIKLATSSENNIYPSNFIKLKNGSIESLVDIQKYDCNLKLCTDENDTTTNWTLTGNASTNFFSTYCNFTPGGFYNTISGKIRLDLDSNGCDSNDINVNNVKVEIDDTTESGYTFTNSNGEYEFYSQSNNVTITPYPNIDYYIQTPLFASVNFLNQLQQQDFCVVSNGNHNDLEINILPISLASPGFDAIYKLVYKNKGTTTQSGTINFSFDDSVLDFVSSNPSFTSQSTGNLTWDFTNLLPFESREIDIVLNLNSPTETPALNSGDLLNFTASVNGQTDETPNDNIATLNQIVVNSYDPNDKTCLEGTTITPSMVGEYIHYLIRFENNGTANAQNIVVKDMIDTNKFEINTLIPIKGSHNFETRISNTNKVEFIFQNINLPFDDANNDGYISFKIKTKPNLVVGNTFSNLANIYFDYNFPIVTNNYTTTVQNTLGLQENDFINNISVYPNPAKNILNFKTEHNISKVEVYDITGRILSSNSVSENKIDLSNLKTGNYILKLYTEKGIMNTKIIKE